jgi:hydrogenase/urease accessory protein HupE
VTPLTLLHLVSTGLGPFYDGLTHLWLTPEDLLPTLALALFAGLRGRDTGRAVLFALPVAWMIGGLAGLTLGNAPDSTWTLVSFLLVGGLVVGDVRLPRGATLIVAFLLGLFHGFLNGADLQALGRDWRGLAGIGLSLFVLVSLTAAFVVSLSRPWTRVAVRVTGSWIVAVGLLLLGWTMSRGH